MPTPQERALKDAGKNGTDFAVQSLDERADLLYVPVQLYARVRKAQRAIKQIEQAWRSRDFETIDIVVDDGLAPAIKYLIEQKYDPEIVKLASRLTSYIPKLRFDRRARVDIAARASTRRTPMNKTQEKDVIRVLVKAGKETLAKTFARSRGYRVKRVKAQTFDPRKAVVYFDLIQDEDAEGGDEMAALKELQKILKVRKIGNEGHDSYGALTCKIDVQSTKDVKNLYKLIDRAKGGGDDIIFVDGFMAQQFRLLPEGVNGPQIETDDIDDFLEDVG